MLIPEGGGNASAIVSRGGKAARVKKTTDAMHRRLGRAVADLRAFLEWSQTDLAEEVTKIAEKRWLPIRPTQVSVSRWETGATAPSPQHRMILSRIAARQKKTAHLAELFRAPVSAWRLVGLVEEQDEADQK
jgi:transcriptional regulator with XRE-family HTH domain